jgi:beta-phosphoglucomutase-like phosphatase (HAD superfamily)
MAATNSTIVAVIFDVDGTLVDSNDHHAKSWCDTLEEFGYQADFAEVRSKIGMGSDKLLPQVIGIEVDSDEGKKLTRRRDEIFKERYLPTIKAFPGVRELVLLMQQIDLKIVAASSAHREDLERLLEIAGVADLIADYTSSSDAERSKPDPDIVEAALGKLELKPEQAIMVGDTPYDVAAAMAARIRTVALRCGGWSDDHLQGAIAIYDDPADLYAKFDASPFRSAGN